MSDVPDPSPVGDVGDRHTPVYRAVIGVSGPIVRGWGRLRVTGLDQLPQRGPTLVVGNHDSYWDPVAAGVAASGHRQIRALSKSTMWGNPVVGWVLDGMGQVPIQRGAGDAGALDAAIAELRTGACIGIYPEGTLSRGTQLRPRGGVGRLARAVPEATVVCVAVRGTVDVIRVPRRPRISVEFFRPAGGPIAPEEEPGAYAARLVAELRAKAPIAISGRAKESARQRRVVEAARAGARSEAEKHRRRVAAGGGTEDDAGAAGDGRSL